MFAAAGAVSDHWASPPNGVPMPLIANGVVPTLAVPGDLHHAAEPVLQHVVDQVAALG